MKRLTEIITEAKNTRLSASALKSLKTEIDNFINKMDNKISSEVKTVTVLLQKYNIYDKEVIGRLIKGTKTEIKSIVTEFGIEERDINEMLSILKKLNTENRTRLIPIMMTKNEREDYMRGEKKDDDITLDLETERGKVVGQVRIYIAEHCCQSRMVIPFAIHRQPGNNLFLFELSEVGKIVNGGFFFNCKDLAIIIYIF